MDTSYHSELSPELGPIDLDFIVDSNVKKIFNEKSEYVNSSSFKEKVDIAWNELLMKINEQINGSGKFDLFSILQPVIDEATNLLGAEPGPEAFDTIIYDIMPIYYALCNLDEVSTNNFAMMQKMSGYRIQDHDTQVIRVLNHLGSMLDLLMLGYENGIQSIDVRLLNGKIEDLKKMLDPSKYSENRNELQN